ncbi:MAG: element excision factor XisH family protein [Aphanizomenon gracile PMC638.10]|nr:element excision factor XisH family protein [Aphanizomenon gracile PMC638.10]
MPAKDIFHDAVKIGLEPEGWVITDDPSQLKS